MFDGLKDKLSGFTSDVEEDVDEEAVEEEPAEDDPEAAVADEHVPEGGPGEETVEPTAEAVASPETTADVDTAAEEPPGGVEPADSSPESDAPAEDDEPDESEATDDGDSRSLTEKAKIMATGKTVIEEEDLQKHLDDLELALLSSDVEMSVANEILAGVEENLTGQTRRRLSSTGNLVRDALREALYDVISVGQFDFDERVQQADSPVVIVFTGVNGVGKTTTIAKMAQYFEDRGMSTVLANGDTYRAGANEQLQKHAENLGKKIITHEQGSDPTAVVYDAVEYAKANDVDVVLGDTAGRLHTSDDLMAQLEKIDRNIDPDMTIFVDEAVAGQDAVNRAREFNDAAEIDGAVLTKADADPQGGAAISVAHVTGKPILFLGTGQDYDDLEPFDPERIVDSLFDE
ncbi:signal recognition particle-docking protein FtsY [Halomicroarcula sp. S1AR25-4]|uniref:signal recognition particle-docking protein FtsY n=1 Tax=Haloarcula sp. S1AR25-4 TaxID=2950538 RepID=UPI00287441D7|nr:signal recognition particle-docking protein FtsY [Halomicroarcula sp. S1AR25-4]MDS0278624.1 signal recognition particle-docking protein FtsY [Halomicroarcula sp. S1AR25-4]